MGTIWKTKKSRRRKKKSKNGLTLTGLLMEGLASQNVPTNLLTRNYFRFASENDRWSSFSSLREMHHSSLFDAMHRQSLEYELS
jgi:hypothetical protein